MTSSPAIFFSPSPIRFLEESNRVRFSGGRSLRRKLKNEFWSFFSTATGRDVQEKWPRLETTGFAGSASLTTPKLQASIQETFSVFHKMNVNGEKIYFFNPRRRKISLLKNSSRVSLEESELYTILLSVSSKTSSSRISKIIRKGLFTVFSRCFHLFGILFKMPFLGV